MADILRSWQCLNARCGRAFESWDKMPECTHCGCVRVQWLPAGGHIRSEGTKVGDAEFRHLADVFKMTDMVSSDRTRGARPLAKAPAAAPAGPPMQFAPGFAAHVDPRVATCQPSAAPPAFTAKVTPGRAMPANGAFPSVRSHTGVEASHKG